MAATKFSTKNKKMIIKGVGKFMAKIPGCDELITLGDMTNLRLDIQLDMVDVEGGDTTAPLDTILRKKVIDITAEDAKFDLNMLRLALGSKLKEGVSGQAYEMKNESLTVVDSGGILSVTVLHDIVQGSDFPKVQVYNQITRQFVDQIYITVNGPRTVEFSGGVSEGDKVIVYYPVEVRDIDPDGYVWVLQERHDVQGGRIKLKYPLFDDPKEGKTGHVSVRLYKENKLLKRTTNKSPKEDEYYIDVDNGEIIFNPYLEESQVYVNYKRPEVVDVLEIGSADFPLTVMVVHDGQFEQKDGSKQAYQTELYACRIKSNITIDAARQTASTQSVTLTVIDPERSDGRLGVIKRYEVAQPKDLC